MGRSWSALQESGYNCPQLACRGELGSPRSYWPDLMLQVLEVALVAKLGRRSPAPIQVGCSLIV